MKTKYENFCKRFLRPKSPNIKEAFSYYLKTLFFTTQKAGIWADEAWGQLETYEEWLYWSHWKKKVTPVVARSFPKRGTSWSNKVLYFLYPHVSTV